VIRFELPSPGRAVETMQSRLALFDTKSTPWEELAKECRSLSYADIVGACEHAAKLAVLDERTRIDPEDLASALRERAASHVGRS